MKMCGTLKIDLFIRYNFCDKIFFSSINIYRHKIKKNLLKTVFLLLSLKIKFAGIFIIIFIFSASKYVAIVSFKLIGGKCFSEVYPKNIRDYYSIQIKFYICMQNIFFS